MDPRDRRLPGPDPAVIFRPLEDGAILLHTGMEVYFGLDEVGTRIWQLLPPACNDIDELCRQLAATWPDVPLETLEADTRQLLDALAEHGLVGPPAAGA